MFLLQHCIIDASGLDFSVDSLSVVYRAGPLFNRSKKLAKEIILSSSCPGLVAALDEFASDIVAQVQQLATLEVFSRQMSSMLFSELEVWSIFHLSPLGG